MMKNVKRILSAVVAGALLCTGTVFSSVSAEETVYPRGDVDRDGACTAEDAVWTMMYYSHKLIGSAEIGNDYFISIGYDMSTPDELEAAMDVNDDASVNASDIAYILHCYALELLLRDMEVEYTSEQLWEYIFSRPTSKSDVSGFIEYLNS